MHQNVYISDISFLYVTIYLNHRTYSPLVQDPSFARLQQGVAHAWGISHKYQI